jgi:hypothetical protein
VIQQAFPENRFAAFVDCELASLASGQIPEPLVITKNYAGQRGCLDNKSKRDGALAGVPWALFEESPAEDKNSGPSAQEHKPAEKAEQEASLLKVNTKEEESDAAAPATDVSFATASSAGPHDDWFAYLGLAE